MNEFAASKIRAERKELVRKCPFYATGLDVSD